MYFIEKYRINLIAGLFMAISGVALFSNLSSSLLWDDEASVGIIARNYISTGKFSGWDGTNLYAYRNGALLDEHLEYKNPIGDVIVCSWAFRFLGENTTSARLFFAFLGWLSLAIWYKISLKLIPDKPSVGLITLGILSTAVFYLMAMRQCRYYALAMFFAAIATYSLLEAETQASAKGRRGHLLVVFISLMGLFFSHYLQFATYILSIGLWYLLFRMRKLEPIQQRELIAVFVVASLMALGIGWQWDITNRLDFTQEQDPFPIKVICLFYYNIREINALNVLQIPVLAFLIFMAIQKTKHEVFGLIGQFLFVIVGYCFILAILSPMSTKINGTAETRYLLLMMPFGAMILAASLMLAWETFTSQAARVALVISFTVFQISNIGVIQKKDGKFTWLLFQFFEDIYAGYPSIYDQPIEFLRTKATKSTLVRCIPDYHSYPLSFYLDKQFKFGSNLSQEAAQRLNIDERPEMSTFKKESIPDYIFVFQTLPENLDTLEYYNKLANYRKIKRFNAYCPGIDPSRPEPNLHVFGPKTGEADRVVELYERY